MFTPFSDMEHQEYDPLTKAVIYQKLTTLYKNPLTHTQLHISVGYRYNDNFPSAIENQLLRSPEYEDWEQKKNILVPLFTRALESNSHRIWLTVTGLEFHTITDNGELAWKTFEDKEEILARIPTRNIPPHITKIDMSELTDVSDLSGSAYTAEYQDKTHVIKVHEQSYQNIDFRAEVEARIRMGKLPHVVEMVGVVVNNSYVPDRSYVQGILLEYSPKGNMKSLLRGSDPPIESSMKKRWAAQIAHGISAIHGTGLIHGDLRCENVVVDENDDARIIDISNGSAFMMGWHPVFDRFDDSGRDVYSLAATIWEIIHDGDDPPNISTALPIDWRGREYGKPITDLIEHCVVELADERPSMATIIETLDGYNICGCKNDMPRDKFNNYEG